MRVKFTETVPHCFVVDGTEGDRTVFELGRCFHYAVDRLAHQVPVGFRFDGASVPRGLWNTFPPAHPKHLGPAAIHDYLYRAKYYPKRLADEIFLAAMTHRGVHVIRRRIMYWAVSWFGRSAYESNSMDDVMAARELAGISSPRIPLHDRLARSSAM